MAVLILFLHGQQQYGDRFTSTPVTHNPPMLSFCCIACLPSWQSTKRHVDPGCLHPYIHPFDTIYWKWSSSDATQLGPVLGVYAYISHPTFSSEAILPLQEQKNQGHQKEGIIFKIAHISSKASFFHPRGTPPHCPPSEARSSEL
jgi:hypothetical protein